MGRQLNGPSWPHFEQAGLNGEKDDGQCPRHADTHRERQSARQRAARAIRAYYTTKTNKQTKIMIIITNKTRRTTRQKL